MHQSTCFPNDPATYFFAYQFSSKSLTVKLAKRRTKISKMNNSYGK